MALTPEQQSAIESAFAKGDYGTASNLLGEANITASQADSIWGPGVSNSAINLGVNFASDPNFAASPLMTLQNASNQVQAANAPQELTPQIAQDLMWRSMTTGLSNAEVAKYGGYDAVKAAYDKAGGTYSLSDIPKENLNTYAQTVANTGSGNLSVLPMAGYELTPAAVASMKASGIDPTQYANQYGVAKSYADIFGVGDVGTIGEKPWANFAGPLSAAQQYDIDLYNQSGTLKSGLSNVFEDSKISPSEAQALAKYAQDNHFRPEDVSRVTGIPLDQVKQALGTSFDPVVAPLKAAITNAYADNNISREEATAIKDMMSNGLVTAADLAASTGLPMEKITGALNAADTYKQQDREKFLTEQTPLIKSGIGKAYADQSLDWNEAKSIHDYVTANNLTPAEMAKITGLSAATVESMLGTYKTMLGDTVKSGQLDDPMTMAQFVRDNKLTYADIEEASGGKYTALDLANRVKPFEALNAYIQTGQVPEGSKQDLQNIAATIRSDPKLLAKYGDIANAFDQVNKVMAFSIQNGERPDGIDASVYQTILGLNKSIVDRAPSSIVVGGPNATPGVSGNYSRFTGQTYLLPIDDPAFAGKGLAAVYDQSGKRIGFQADWRSTGINLAPDTYTNSTTWDASGNSQLSKNVTRNTGDNFLTEVGGALNSLGPIPALAVAWATDGMSLEWQVGAQVALQVAQGVPLETALKNGIASYAGAQVVNIPAVKQVVSSIDSSVLQSMLKGGISAATSAGVLGKDIGTAALAGITGGAVNSVVSGIAKDFDLTPKQTGVVSAAAGTFARAKLSGATDTQALQAAIQAGGMSTAKTVVKALKESKTAGLDISDDTIANLDKVTYDPKVASEVMSKYVLASAGNTTNTTSDAGGDLFHAGEISGAPIFAGTAKAASVSEPVGYRLMTFDEADNKPQGSYYDITQNAWFVPDDAGQEDLLALQKKLSGAAPDGYGTTVATGPSSPATTGPLSPAPSTIPEVVITSTKDPVIPEVVVTDTRPTTIPEVVVTDTRPTTTPTPTVTPAPTPAPAPAPAPTPINPAPTTKTTSAASPLAAAAPTIPKLDSSPQGLTSTVQRNKKILKELKMLFGTLTPELVSALEDRGIHVPRVEELKEPSIEEELASEKPETPQQLAEDKALETKFAASGGTVGPLDTMNSMISSATPKASSGPSMLSAAPVLELPSRWGALKHLREGISARPSGGLAKGGLPHKYTEATPDGHKPEFITGLTGYYASGKGTGQSDDIDAILHDGDYVADADLVAALGDGSSKAGAEALEKFRRQVPHHEYAEGGQPVPAKIADGEYVFPASFVTALGKGDNKAGAALLDKMREAIREHKRSAPVNKIPPKAKSPLDYLKMVKG